MTKLQKTDIVAVIGAGTMGAGIAQVAATAGHRTLLYDTSRTALSKSVEAITQGLNRQRAKGKITKSERSAIIANIHPIDRIREVAGARFVIEAIIEDLATKQSLFSQLENICGKKTILASNTSSLSITAIASALSRPGNLIGTHFSNPAQIMKLVEVISGIRTRNSVTKTVFETFAAWGKQPVLARSTPGFIVNRVIRPFYAEALRLLEDGASDIATLDELMRQSGGFRMGPFELMDFIGHDVNYAVTCSIYKALYHDPRFLPSVRQKELIDAGFLGRKSGRGFYKYRGSAKNPQPFFAKKAKSPATISISGNLGVAQPLIGLWQDAGIRVIEKQGEDGSIRAGSASIALSDGRTATRRGADNGQRNTIVFDLALDYQSTGCIALSPSDKATAESLQSAAGLFQKLGKEVVVLDDTPGLAVMRTICMLTNEAAEAVQHQVCDANAVDIAMQNSIGYPVGPLAWGDTLSAETVLRVLENLQKSYGQERYRPSQLLQRKADSDTRFHP